MSSIRIEIINQAGGMLPREFAEGAAKHFGHLRYHTSDLTPMEGPVEIVPSPGYRRNSFISRISSWLLYTFLVSIRILFVPRRPLLFIITNPPIAPFLGYLAKKIKHQPYVILFYDFYPEAFERFANVSPSSLISRMTRWMNRIAVKNADAVITISRDLERTMAQYYPANQACFKHFIVPTWVNTKVIKPRPKNENWFAIEHSQTDKMTVLYGGNLGSVHDLSILPALAETLREDTGIHFLVLASATGRRSIEVECEARALKNISFLPLQDEQVLPFSLPTADVGIVALALGGEGISMPSKTYYLMSAGCAILGFSSQDSDLADVISKHECGVNVLPTDVSGAATILRMLRADPVALKRYKTQARIAAEQHYDRDHCINMLLKIVEPILSRDHTA